MRPCSFVGGVGQRLPAGLKIVGQRRVLSAAEFLPLVRHALGLALVVLGETFDDAQTIFFERDGLLFEPVVEAAVRQDVLVRLLGKARDVDCRHDVVGYGVAQPDIHADVSKFGL